MTHTETLKLALERARGALAYVAVGNVETNPNLAKSTCRHAVQMIDMTMKELAEQPEQEPVAWINPDEQNARKAFHWVESEEFSSALYTTPPQRTWVGLTESEIIRRSSVSVFRFYDAIEAKLKEKNT